jgi:hypothetical protein
MVIGVSNHSLELPAPPPCVRCFVFISTVLSASHARFRGAVAQLERWANRPVL